MAKPKVTNGVWTRLAQTFLFLLGFREVFLQLFEPSLGHLFDLLFIRILKQAQKNNFAISYSLPN